MYKILKIVALSLIGFIANELYPIKLTNSTKEDLVYSCGNPANRTSQKTELKKGETVEIGNSEGYVQIYIAKNPKILRGKYFVTKGTEDLTVVPGGFIGYEFIPTSEVGTRNAKPNPHPSMIRPPLTRPKIAGQQTQIIQPKVSPAQNTSSPKLTHMTKDRPMNKFKRIPSRNPKIKNLQPSEVSQLTNNDSVIKVSSEDSQPTIQPIIPAIIKLAIPQETEKPTVSPTTALDSTTDIYKPIISRPKIAAATAKLTYNRYFTKKKIAATRGVLGTVGAAYLILRWWRNI